MPWTHEHSFPLAASVTDVFAALTTPDALRTWFAESVEVGGAVGAPFRFWGRHSLATPTAAHATQVITSWESDHLLAFSWTLDDVATSVHITLAADDDACRATVRHDVSGTLPYPRGRALIDDHWRLAFGNLGAYLAGGSGIMRPDFEDASPTVTQVLVIDAPVETVFRSLITPALVNEWFGAKASVIEPWVGGRYELGWQYTVDGRDVIGGPTRILEFAENERLVLDWPDWRGDDTVTGQTITFQLEPLHSQTRLTFVHAGFTRAVDVSDYPFGWTWFLGQLSAVSTRALSAG